MSPASFDDGELWCDDGAGGDLGSGGGGSGSSFGTAVPTADDAGSARRCSGLSGTPANEQHQPRGRTGAWRTVWCVESTM
jgi:hypothetical protein